MKFACLLAIPMFACTGAARSQQPRPDGADPRALFSSDDYPAAAVQRKEEGTVRARLTIGTDGRVKACKIMRSSNSEALDTATCALLMRRAKFAPARDANGNAVEDSYVTPPISWRIQDVPVAAGQRMQQIQPGRFRCNAPAGHRVDQELVPLRPGQDLRLAMRLIREAEGATHPGTSGLLWLSPRGRSVVGVGRAVHDPFQMYAAAETPGVPQQVIYQYPLTKNWIILKLTLDDRGFLTVRGNDLAKVFATGSAQVTEMAIQCSGSEWEIDVWPRSYVPAGAGESVAK
ncbi:MAG: energy transducer TonB [Sphingomicrobium sp.]